jgi:hypothetical protein
MESIKTGDVIKITLATTGQKCQVCVGAETFPGITGITITAKVGEITRLSLDAFYPFPPVIRPDGEIARETFEGYFVSREDWELFDAWRKRDE